MDERYGGQMKVGVSDVKNGVHRGTVDGRDWEPPKVNQLGAMRPICDTTDVW